MQSITPVELLLLVQALPLSLATTQGIEFSFFSCRYLDVSVPCVPLLYTTLLMYGLVSFFPDQSFLIRISVDIMDICSSPQLFAAYHVLLRLLVPRHSPYALSSLTFVIFITQSFFGFCPKTFSQLLITSLQNLLSLILYKLFFNNLTLFFIYIFFNVLSYYKCINVILIIIDMVELRRVELLTSCLQGRRSSQLSYSPIFY